MSCGSGNSSKAHASHQTAAREVERVRPIEHGRASSGALRKRKVRLSIGGEQSLVFLCAQAFFRGVLSRSTNPAPAPREFAGLLRSTSGGARVFRLRSVALFHLPSILPSILPPFVVLCEAFTVAVLLVSLLTSRYPIRRQEQQSGLVGGGRGAGNPEA